MRTLRALLAFILLSVGCSQVLAAEFPANLATLPQADVSIVTKTGTHHFRVWIAADNLSRQQGLMYVRELPADRGMLFLYSSPYYASFWMKNTFISLDLAFIDADGRVVNVALGAKPHSLDPIWSAGLVTSALELVAGTAARIELKPGDRVTVAPLAAPDSH